jgi:uncharacterized membrane protein YphA (DoxX/SURF4 family)
VRFLALIGHVTVMAIFALAGWSKIRSGQAFVAFGDGTPALRSVDGLVVRVLTVAVIVAEVSTAGLLAVGFAAGWAAVTGFSLAGLLLASFTAALTIAVRRGDQVPCRCFGASDTNVGWRHVVRNIALIVCTVFGASGRLMGDGAVDAPTVVAAVAVGTAMTIITLKLDDVVATFRPGAAGARSRGTMT